MADNKPTITDSHYISGRPFIQARHALVTAAWGYAQSYFNPGYPAFLKDNFNEARKKGRVDLTELVQWFGETAGFGLGIGQHINSIVSNPSDAISYLPVLTNVIGGVTIALNSYRARRERMDEEKSEE